MLNFNFRILQIRQRHCIANRSRCAEVVLLLKMDIPLVFYNMKWIQILPVPPYRHLQCLYQTAVLNRYVTLFAISRTNKWEALIGDCFSSVIHGVFMTSEATFLLVNAFDPSPILTATRNPRMRFNFSRNLLYVMTITGFAPYSPDPGQVLE